jgi:iron complex transport system substrate-binding protein
MRRYATLLVVSLLVASMVAVPVATADGSTAAKHTTTYEPCEFPVTLTDATGENITIEERPDRVTTTNPSAAQTMWEIGGKSQVVGLTRHAMYLDGAADRTDVSADFGADTEKVVGTEPDLVLVPNASSGDVEKLRAAGLKVYHFREATDVNDIRAKTTTTGKLTGNCEGAAEANAWMDANVDAVEGMTADVDERPHVLHPIGGGYVVGDETFINAMLGIAGADNVAARDHTGYVSLNPEVILELEDEFGIDYLVLTRDSTSLVSEEPYASTTAGQENNTVVLRTQYIHQPAPRSVVFTAHNATEQLHPDRYSQDSYVPRSSITVEPAAEETPTATPTETSTPSEMPTTATPTQTDTSIPGFGPVVALIAVVVGAVLTARRP